MNSASQEIYAHLNHIVTAIPKTYVDALLALHEKLDDKDIKWTVNGDLAEALKVVQVEPDCIEIVSSIEDSKRIFFAVKEFAPSPISFQTRRLPRNAVVASTEYPVYIRGFFFDFSVNSVQVKVQGGLQFKVGEWDWGDTYDFTPDCVYVVGKKTAVTPLQIKYELYRSLGWTDRMEKIQQALQHPGSQRNCRSD